MDSSWAVPAVACGSAAASMAFYSGLAFYFQRRGVKGDVHSIFHAVITCVLALAVTWLKDTYTGTGLYNTGMVLMAKTPLGLSALLPELAISCHSAAYFVADTIWSPERKQYLLHHTLAVFMFIGATIAYAEIRLSTLCVGYAELGGILYNLYAVFRRRLSHRRFARNLLGSAYSLTYLLSRMLMIYYAIAGIYASYQYGYRDPLVWFPLLATPVLVAQNLVWWWRHTSRTLKTWHADVLPRSPSTASLQSSSGADEPVSPRSDAS